MNNDIGFFIFVAITVLVAIAAGIVACVFSIRSRKLAGGKAKQYDERQKIAQGKAYTAAYWTLFGYIVINTIVESSIYEWAKPQIAAFMGIALSIAVFAVYCIATDAYFGAKENVKGILICMAILIVPNAAALFTGGPLVVDGMLGLSSINLAAIVLLLAVFIALIIKRIARGKESEDE